jgi:hypothetical protein
VSFNRFCKEISKVVGDGLNRKGETGTGIKMGS